jgi:hypothetical protein
MIALSSQETIVDVGPSRRRRVTYPNRIPARQVNNSGKKHRLKSEKHDLASHVPGDSPITASATIAPLMLSITFFSWQDAGNSWRLEKEGH